MILCLFVFHYFLIGGSTNYLPSHTLTDEIIHHTAYTLQYDEKYEQADWVAYKLTKEMVKKPAVKRTNKFRADPLVKTGSAKPSDYAKSGYDKGHLCPAGDMAYSAGSMSESFYMSNMSPQMAGFNRGIWKRLEDKARAWARDNDEIHIVTGPVLKRWTPYNRKRQGCSAKILL
ncbi:MAG: DNA/RNA non-specific endonuclease [bacterium]